MINVHNVPSEGCDCRACERFRRRNEPMSISESWKRVGLLCIVPLFIIALATANAGTTQVIDGDTIHVGSEKIRLIGPDAPETYKSRCTNESWAGMKAKMRLKELVANQSLRIERDGKDKYGRTLAYVYLPDGREVGEVLITEGLALRWRPGRKAWAERARHWCP